MNDAIETLETQGHELSDADLVAVNGGGLIGTLIYRGAKAVIKWVRKTIGLPQF